MVANGEFGGSEVNTTSNASNAVIRQYIAQNYEHQNAMDPESMEDEERRRMLEESEAAQNLLRQISANYSGNNRGKSQSGSSTSGMSPAQLRQHREKQHDQQNNVSDKAVEQEVGKLASKLPLNGSNVPPKDESIMSLFIMGIESDLEDYFIKEYFEQFGKVASLVCIHAARCAFVNFTTRKVPKQLQLLLKHHRDDLF